MMEDFIFDMLVSSCFESSEAFSALTNTLLRFIIKWSSGNSPFSCLSVSYRSFIFIFHSAKN